MGKQYTSMELSAWTTGAGIAIGTGIQIGGIIQNTAATLTVVDADGTQFIHSGGSISFAVPIALTGAITATSAAGSFSILFRQ